MHYENSINILLEFSLGIILPLQSIHSIVCCRVELRDFLGAVESLTQGINIATRERSKKQAVFGNHSSDYLRQTILDYEIDRIFLMLLEVPTHLSRKPKSASNQFPFFFFFYLSSSNMTTAK